nr:hypothetical protein [Streptomyces sp. WAC04770]
MVLRWRWRLERYRSFRSVLLPLLAMLVIAHLAGAGHTSPGAVPHEMWPVSAAAPSEHAPHSPVERVVPFHEHDEHGHMDHSVDRPRAADDAPAGPSAEGVRVAEPVMSPSRTACGAGSRPPVPAGLSDPSLLCIWRL